MSALQHSNHFDMSLEKNDANYVPLTPISFLERTAQIFPQKLSVIYGARRYTWAQTYERAKRLASALAKRGVGLGDTVSLMAANTPEIYEAHFGVPMTGAVLNTLNTRLDAKIIAFTLDHAETKVLITDKEFSSTIRAAVAMAANKPLIIDIEDLEFHPEGDRLGRLTYEELLAEGEADYDWKANIHDEWQAISLNYTSGTTGNPKGVVYHHRGAYLNALGNIVAGEITQKAVYLWTLPMFHCNGWCFPWTVAAVMGTSVCLRRVEAKAVYHLVAEEKVTHACGAPIVLGMLNNAKPEERTPFSHAVKFFAAGAPVPAAVIYAAEQIGFKVTHVYGLTEVYGPSTICIWKDEFNELSPEDQGKIRVRQGVRYPVQEDVTVMDPDTMTIVKADGQTMGEVMFRGNIVMKGYLKNPKATEEAFSGGWFHTGDLAVLHPDGYIELKDRSKDIIISGGENISSIEVEGVLYQHPSVLEAAVVARPDEKWGETPCAFVTLKEGANVTEAEIVQFCRDNLAHYKCPRTIVFSALPKTSTGKIQKFVLRDRARELSR